MLVGRQRPLHESFLSVWSALFLGGLSVVGTMIMRKFHNSLAVGFFMGVTVGCSQWLAVLSLVYWSYARDQQRSEYYSSSSSSYTATDDAAADSSSYYTGTTNSQNGKEETLLAVLAAVQAILLGSFAAILAAHRSEILDKPENLNATAAAVRVNDADSVDSYDPPPVAGRT